ncbi:MAG: glycosyltransferase [Microthrixaceae bacterium]
MVRRARRGRALTVTRILHLVASDHRRGAETFAVELAEHHRAAGHEVRVMAVSGTGGPDRLPVEVAGRGRRDPVAFGRILRAARWSEVVVSFGSSSVLPGSAAARLCGRPFVYRNIGDPSVWGAVRASDLRIGLPLRSARRVVALYDGARDSLVRAYSLDPARVRVIPRGVPADRFPEAGPAERAEALARLGLDPSRRWLAYVGALSEEKDPLLAVRALRDLPDDVGLVVAGGGPLEADVASEAAGLGERCRLLGTVADVTTVHAAATALVLPSRTEGIPGAVVEAGLTGRPAVAFAVGGVPSVVVDGVTGRLVAERTPDAVASAAVDVLDAAAAMGAAARAHCLQHFSMATVGAAWSEVVREAVARPRGRRVLQVTSSTARRGAEVFAHQLSAELRADGLEVTEVALRRAAHERGLPVRVLGDHRFRPRSLWRLACAMRASDVVVVHGGSGLVPVALLAPLVRRPYVYRNIGDPSYWGQVALRDLRIGLPLRRAATVVALSGPAGEVLHERYRVRPERIRVLPNAVPAREFPRLTAAERAATRRALDLDADTPVVAYLGSLAAEKRPGWVLDAVAAVPGSVGLIAGAGPLRGELERRAAAEAPGRVRLLGSTDRPVQILGAADVLVVPSRTEGMPAVVIEAAMVGVPVVATAVGAVPELLASSEYGRLVPADSVGSFVEAVRDVLAGTEVPVPAGRIRETHDVATVARSWAEVLAAAARR